MEKKKTFSILELDKEERYIEEMALEGKKLKSVDRNGHIYEDSTPASISAVIEYWIDEPPINNFHYENQGLNQIGKFKGSKGYWLYFTGPFNKDLVKREDDYQVYIKMLSNRYNIFWSIIPMTVAVFGLYMYFTSKNPIFFILVIAPLLVFYYLRGLKGKIDSKNKNKKENR